MSTNQSQNLAPLYDPIKSSEPTATDLKIDATLKEYMDVEMKLESDEEMYRRNLVLKQVENIFIDWVRQVAMKELHMPEEEAIAAGGKLYISGSHRLGVREPKADIDSVCVAPNFCTREHFFSSLKQIFQTHPLVTEFSAVEGALVPLMSFDFDGVSIDLLFARLAENQVPEKLDILDDSILSGVDEATEKSLNGPRVTEMIGKLVEAVGTNLQTFLIVLRCVRRWAKRKGLYGNKLGYLGGVNCNILVAFVCQLFPKASSSTLLTRFFQTYASWQWPKPVMLNRPRQTGQGGRERVVWSAEMYPHELMPLVTPAYPAMNSANKVTKHTLAVMQQEFSRSHAVIKSIIAERGKNFQIDWSRLFEPSDFFVRYPHYLGLHIVGAGPDAESRSWIGYCESRILGFTRYLEYLPLQHPLHFFPAVSRTDKSANSVCYFVGFDIDRSQFVGRSDKNVYVDECTQRFQAVLYDPERGYRGPASREALGLEFLVEHYPWRRLPRSVFDSLGGRDVAKTRRAELLAQKTATSAAPGVTEIMTGTVAEGTPGGLGHGEKRAMLGQGHSQITPIQPTEAGARVRRLLDSASGLVAVTGNGGVVDGIADLNSKKRGRSDSLTATEDIISGMSQGGLSARKPLHMKQALPVLKPSRPEKRLPGASIRSVVWVMLPGE